MQPVGLMLLFANQRIYLRNVFLALANIDASFGCVYIMSLVSSHSNIWYMALYKYSNHYHLLHVSVSTC